MYVCICQAVTDQQIDQAVVDGVRSFNDLQEVLGVSTGCGVCTENARRRFETALAAATLPLAA